MMRALSATAHARVAPPQASSPRTPADGEPGAGGTIRRLKPAAGARREVRPRTRRASRRAAGKGGDGRSVLLVVGIGRRRDAVASRLMTLNVLNVMIRAVDPDALPAVSMDGLAGVVLVEPSQATATFERIRFIQGRPRGDRLPLFLVLPAGAARKHIDDLYRENVTAVFEWPRELSVLPHVIAAVLDAGELDSQRSSPDAAGDPDIARSVREVVRSVSPELAHTVGVSVRQGKVSLAGNAVHRRQVARLEGLTENVDGVRAVENLVTVTSPRQHRQDRAGARALQRAVNDMVPGQRATVAVFGDVGVVTGSVEDPELRNRVGGLLQDWPSLERVVNGLRVT